MIFMLLWVVLFFVICAAIRKLTCGICTSPTCLVGKTAIVTGGNSGIGYNVCLNLASRGCKVIIADKDDSEKSRLEIIKQSNHPNIHSKILNLASFQSIRKFAHEIASELDKLDILVNNAGIPCSTIVSEDNLDLTGHVNYFGPFLLTHLLVDLLKKSESGRIIFTSSIGAFFTYLNVNTFGQSGKISGNLAYNNSKLANIIAADIFAEKLKNTTITVNSVHPGLVGCTNVLKNIPMSGFFYICIRIFVTVDSYIAKNFFEGSQTTVHVAVSHETAKLTGKFFCDCRKFFKPLQAYDKELCKKIWDISEKCVLLKPEEKL